MTMRWFSRMGKKPVVCSLLLAFGVSACGAGLAGDRARMWHSEASSPMAPEAAEQMARESEAGAVMQPMAARDAPRFNTESYDHVQENAFHSVARHPLSTFSVDVDTASYSNVRRFLAQGSLPPPDAVRIEELINYFAYDYPDPKGSHPFSVTTEVSAAPWNAKHRLVHIGLQGKRVSEANLPPRNLVFLLDVSGSMGTPNKLPLLRRALKQLVEGFGAQDRVSIVVYAGASGLVLPPTSGADQPRILAALDLLEAGGSTNGGEGIELAYAMARQQKRAGSINRVILATDGDFNVGTTSEGDLVRLIEQERKSGVFLTVLGFGMGNYQDSTLEQLADHGNGNYAYIDTISEARKVLVTEAGATMLTIAKDVKIQVEFNPQAVSAYRLIGYENRMLQAEDFNDDQKDAGEIGAGHSVTALYEVVPAGQPVPGPGAPPLKYQQPARTASAAHSGEMLTVKLRYKAPAAAQSQLISAAVTGRTTALAETSNAYRFSAAVAAYGMLLRRSEHHGAANFAMVERLARGATGADRFGYRSEFLGLVATARRLRGES